MLATTTRVLHIPISGSTQQSQFLGRHVARDELVHGVTDEQIRMLDVVPQVLPNLLLRRPSDVNEIATDLNVRPVDDGDVRADFLDQGYKAWHLRVI